MLHAYPHTARHWFVLDLPEDSGARPVRRRLLPQIVNCNENMYRFPKTEKGLRARISSYKSSMRKEIRTYGSISDGAGKRYLLFWLYFVLNDAKGAMSYLKWYENEFEDDSGEPVQQLCGALILRRAGETQKAKYMLACLMLSNLYVIPKLLGESPAPHPIWHSSNRAVVEYANNIPQEVLNSLTDADRNWMKELYDSLEFRRYRKRHIGIYGALEHTQGVEKRSPLVQEAGTLLDELKRSCG